jgi:hypothetical protein
MPGFEGAGAYLGFGYERAKGIPGDITSYMGFQTENIDPKWMRKPNPNINPRKARSKGRLMQVDIKGDTKGAPDSESQSRLRASHQGKVVDSVLDGPNSVYQHVLTALMPGDADPATYRKTLSGIIYRDDGVPLFVMGGRVEKMTLVIKAGDYVEMTHSLLFENTTESRQPIAAVGNNVAFTGVVLVRGVRRDPENAADSVFFKATTGGALDGTAKIKVKLGVGGAYGGAEIPIVADKWTDVLDGANPGPVEIPMGPSYTNPFQVLFHPGAPGDVLTVGDLWESQPRIPIVASPPYTTREVYDYGQVMMLVDSKQFVWKTVTLTGTKPRVEDRGLGSYFVQQVLDNGEWTWQVDLERSYVDRTFINLIKAGATSSALVTIRGDRIGASAFRDLHEWSLPAVQYDDAGTNVANANQEQEKVVMQAHDNRVDPICTERIINTIPAL